MKATDKIFSLIKIAQTRIFKRHIPLAVRFQITNRCTLQCGYCAIWKTKKEELSTETICRIITDLAALGTKRISLSGGEPLIRHDCGMIIDHCWKSGIYPEMNSNGTLVPEKIAIVEKLDFLKLSLDGPEHVHDAARSKGSYKKVIAAAESAFAAGVRFGFACTITKYNIEHLDHLLDLAEKYRSVVAFQPIKQMYKGITDIEELAPDTYKYEQAISRLIERKQQGSEHIRNSLRGLKHILKWPSYEPLKCWAGRIFCIIDVNGDIVPCDRTDFPVTPVNCVEIGVKNAIDKLPGIKCSGCGFCGALELNYLMNYQWDILTSLNRIIEK
jgi:MoaA/NifB/PqqE/SkfB family radical SAM enzyme